MEAGDVYESFALVATLSAILSVLLVRRNPALAYLASVLATVVLTDVLMNYRFSVMEQGAFYGAVYFLGAVYAALGLVVLHLVLRIGIDLLETKRG